MKLDRPLVIATRNQGKVSEFKELLKDFDIEIKSLQDFGPLPEIQEDGETFEDNAVKKARFAARILGLPALADDSGLVVRALGGLPGVHSARYAGEHGDDLANNRKLLQAMKGIKYREATFVCVGIITEEITGTGGFGYDPVFYYPPLGKTFAEMTPEEKNRVSHRGKAMAELREEFDKVLIWLRQRLEEEPF